MNEYIRPHRNSAVLLTIDTQNDFTLAGAPAEIDGTAEAVPQIQRLVETFRSQQTPIVHVVRLYKEDGSNVDQCRKSDIESGAKVVRPGTDGAEPVAELKPSTGVRLNADRLLDGKFQEIGPQEYVMYKPRWSAFYRTYLNDFLEVRSIDTIVVCGCNFPNCPRTTVYEASERDYRIVFVPDATSGVYERGVQELENIGVAVKKTEDAIDWITK
ncbi:cysteine hydrolase family protein [Natrinema halophilum]|uniref:Cysteine hydrolase n=1 Tax=Natrinema halophilum TaxID=1699371 RepID=A0A7D5GQY9_9EURY|nr:isochorismatase family cysteine hydrolase [Natrinema halophilum]QLG48169.1 cysteine hydrolase [Natrinema halophilum]